MYRRCDAAFFVWIVVHCRLDFQKVLVLCAIREFDNEDKSIQKNGIDYLMVNSFN